MIRSENGFKVLYTFVDPGEEPVGSYVEKAKGIVEKELSLPPGYFLEWSGQYQNILRIQEHLKAVVPLVLVLILILLYLHSHSLALSLIVLLAVPFSLTGAFLLLHLLDYHVSTAVWIGIIALMGLDAETGIVMLLYLELAYRDRRKGGPLGKEELLEAIVDGAARRLRPKAMTVGVALLGLLPLLLGTGIGADLMKRIAAPMIGGVISSFVMELFVYPAIYKIYREIRRE
jgi:Cu(I)/Ag(I) efflux system membrane protein CusA/SilA